LGASSRSHISRLPLHDALPIWRCITCWLLADATDEVILATDYDREGELIGVEALETLRSRRTELPAKRARFSAMSPSEVRRSFEDRKSTRLNSSHEWISYAVFC